MIPQRVKLWIVWACILLSGNATAQLLTKGEYFFDNDPGEGFGTLIYVNPQFSNPTITFNAPANGLAPGFHFFSMRFQDQFGHWGITGTHKIYINQPFFPFPDQVLSMPIVAAEYFWDADIGCGNGIPFYIPAGNNIVSTFSVIAPSTAGLHILNVRAQDLDGRWGITKSKSVQVWPASANVANVDFTLSPYPAALNQSISMTSQVTGALPGAIYEWDFDSDGAADASTTNANHAYSTAGYKHVALTVCNPPSSLAQSADMRYYFTNASLVDAGGLLGNLSGSTQWQYGRQGDLSGAPNHPATALNATGSSSQLNSQYTISYWMKGNSNTGTSIQLGSSALKYNGIDLDGYHRWSNGYSVYANSYNNGVNGLYNGQWRHVALVVNGSDVKTYIDGTLTQTSTSNNIGLVVNQIQLGPSATQLDDVLFFDTILSAVEVQNLWQEMYASTKVHEIPVGPVFNLQLSANGPLEFCSGSSVILTAPLASSYYWNTGETTQSIVVTETGSYQCVMNFGAYSIASVQKDVLVRPTPVVTPSVYQPTNGNNNGSVFLSVTGGSFPVYTYAWNNGNTTAGLTQLSGGTYTVNVSDGYCPQSLTFPMINVVVNPPIGFIEAEFFYGNVDPGIGNGISFLVPMNALTTGGAFDVPTTGLAIGFHLLSVRTRHTDQSWSMTKTHWIHIKPDYTNPVSYDTLDMVHGELFFDNVDPGTGNGIPVVFNANTALSFTANNISLASLSPGYHKVSVRMQDSHGDWGITRTTVFLIDYVLPPTLSPLQSPMVAAEYFYDNVDPGQGNGIPISVPVDSSLNVNRVINTAGLTIGTHRLNIRVKDLSGVWSTTKTSFITITNPCSLPQANFVTAESSLNQLTLTSTSTGTVAGATYSWDIDANGIIDYTTQNALHTFANSGWHDVMLTVSNAVNCQSSVLQTIQVGNPLSNVLLANGPLTFCQGNQVVLYAPAGTGFIWNDFSQADSLLVTESGLYQCAYIDLNGNYVFSTSLEVLVIPSIDVVTTVANATNGLSNGGALVQLSGGSGNVYSYNWSNGVNTPAITAVASANYTVTVSDGVCPQTLNVQVGNTVIQPLTGIIAAEYYFDTDPGVGNGISMMIAQGTPVLSYVNVPINLAAGYHTLFVRTMDAQWEWGFSRPMPFMVWDPNALSQNTPADNLIRGEYFFDNNDPGAGNAVSFAVSNPGVNVLESISINTTGLNSGVHFVYVRFQDADGRWGMIARSMFIIEFVLPPNLPDFQFPIVAMEYFFGGSDPGVGNGIAADIPIGTSVNSSASINTAGLAVGAHKLSVRVKDQWGIWSHTKVSNIQVVAPTCPVPVVSFDLTGSNQNTNISVVNTSTNTLLSSVYSWDWNGDGIYESTGEYAAHSFVNPGNYLVVLQVNNGNATCTSTASQLITVGANPSATLSVNGALEICEGDSTQLTAPIGSNYIWSNAAVTSSIVVSETGVYNCTFQTANGVWVQTNSVFVLVRPSLVLNPAFSSSTNGLSNGSAGVIVTGGSTPAYDYSWSSGATTPIIASVLAGNYSVTVTDGFCPETLSVVVDNTIVNGGLVRGEFFWGTTDPGAGNGTDIFITQGSPVNAFANIATTGLPAGYHLLSIRMINTEGKWGITRTMPVYISPAQIEAVSELPDITEVEYFFDNSDPGVTNGVSLPLTASDTLITETYSISCAALGPGNHKISMRVKDSFGKWSITKTAVFNTCFPPAAPALTLNALGDTINAGQACLGSTYNFVAQNNSYSLRWTSPNGLQTHVGNSWNRTNLSIQDSGFYWVQALGNEPGCYSEPSLYHLTILEQPVVTENLSGLQVVCPYDGPEAYYINPVENAVFYTWNMPTGAALLTGNNTNNASITFENVLASSGSLSITAANQCGSSTSAILALNFPCVEEDYDADGTINLLDNCYLIANADQLDSDADGIGNVCDNCPTYANPDQALAVLYQDADGDGFGNSAITVMGCPGTPGSSAVGGDCNDANPLMNSLFNFYTDSDGDGYGAGNVLTPVCAQSASIAPAGYSVVNTDCNNNNAAIKPGAAEICVNGIDEDCSGSDLICPGNGDLNTVNVISIGNYGTGTQTTLAINFGLGADNVESTGTGIDRWYQFTAQANAIRLELMGSTSVGDDNDLSLYDYTTTTGQALIPLDIENDVTPTNMGISTDGGNEVLYYDQLEVGTMYWICVRNLNNNYGSSSLRMAYLRGSAMDIGAYTNYSNTYGSTCQNFKCKFKPGASYYTFNLWNGNIAQGTANWIYSTAPTTTSNATTVVQLGKLVGANINNAPIQHTVKVDAHYALKDAYGNTEQVVGYGVTPGVFTLNAEADLNLRTTDRCPVYKSPTTGSMATNRSVCGTSRYIWQLTMNAPSPGLPQVVNGPVGGSRVFSINTIPGINTNQQYNVRIASLHVDQQTQSNYGSTQCMRTYGFAGAPVIDNEDPTTQQWKSRMLIYPNPNQGEGITINLEGMEGDVNIELLDATGRLLEKTTWNVEEYKQREWRFAQALSSGLYEIRIQQGSMQESQRMLVVR